MYKVNQKHSDSNKMKIIFLQKGLVGTRGQGDWEISVTKFLFRNVLETVVMGLHNSINVICAMNCTLKNWLKWYILFGVYFTTFFLRFISLVTNSTGVSGPELEDSSAVLGMWLQGHCSHFQSTASKTEIYNDPEISLITSFMFCCPIVYHMATASFKRGWEREAGDRVPSKSSENSTTKRKNGGIDIGEKLAV